MSRTILVTTASAIAAKVGLTSARIRQLAQTGKIPAPDVIGSTARLWSSSAAQAAIDTILARRAETAQGGRP